MGPLTLKIKDSGHLYVPRSLGPVDVSWIPTGESVRVRIRPRPGTLYRQYVYLLPRPWLRAALFRRNTTSISVEFDRDGDGWVGEVSLKPGWRAVFERNR
jgi:hypothetical protein